jgi:hypothetical protein
MPQKTGRMGHYDTGTNQTQVHEHARAEGRISRLFQRRLSIVPAGNRGYSTRGRILSRDDSCGPGELSDNHVREWSDTMKRWIPCNILGCESHDNDIEILTDAVQLSDGSCANDGDKCRCHEGCTGWMTADVDMFRANWDDETRAAQAGKEAGV